MFRKKKGWLLQATVVSILFALLVWAFSSGIESRPIVKYKFKECPKEVNFNLEKEKTLFAELGIANTGETEASVIMTFHGENITVSNSTKKAYNQINATDVAVLFSVDAKTQEYYFGEKIDFVVNESTQGIYYEVHVTKRKDESFSGKINEFFGEIKGFYPVRCRYVKEIGAFGTKKFVLVE